MSEMMRKTFVAKQIDPTTFTVEAYASTKDIDRDGEVILPTAWDLSTYNGIVVDSHDYQTIGNAIAKVTQSSIDDKGLKVTIQYLVGKGNDKADWAWVLVSNNLASYSVGFIPIDKIPGNGENIKTIYTKTQLLEISQVVVPANPYAVQDAIEYEPLIKAFKHIKEAIPVDATEKGADVEGKKPPEMKDYASDEELSKACGMDDEVVKYGRVLSESNRQKIKGVLDGVSGLQKALKDIEQPLQELLDLSEVQQDSAPLGATKSAEDEVLTIVRELKNLMEV